MKAHPLVLVLLCILAGGPRSQSVATRLHEASYAENVVGDLDRAIRLYRAVVEAGGASPADRALARYRLGMCYVALGGELRRQGLDELELLSRTGSPALAERAKLLLAELRGAEGLSLTEVGGPHRGSIGFDGRRTAYVHWPTGDIGVAELATGEETLVTDDGSWDGPSAEWRYGQSVVLNADSSAVAFVWQRGDAQELHVLDLASRRRRVLLEAPGYAMIVHDWRRDGREILISRGRELVFVEVAGGAARPLAVEGLAQPHAARLSPDGRTIAVAGEWRPGAAASAEAAVAVALVAAAGDGVVRRVAEEAYAPFWTPDGRWLIFGSIASGRQGTWAARVAEGAVAGAPRLIEERAGMSRRLGITDDGRYWFVFGGAREVVHTVAFDPLRRRVRGSPSALESALDFAASAAPRWSPDGTRLAFVADLGDGVPGRGRSALVVHDFRSGVATRVVPRGLVLPGTELVHESRAVPPRWLRDGRTMVFREPMRTPRRLAALSVDDGSWTVWADVGRETGSQRVSPDERRLLHRVFDDVHEVAPPSLHESDLATGEMRRVFDGVCNLAEYSPDGETIAVLSRGDLFVVARDGSGARRLCGGAEGLPIGGWGLVTGLVWGPRGDWILVGTGEERRVVCVDVRDGSHDDVGLQGARDLCCSPDGRQLAMTLVVSGQPARLWTMAGYLPAEEQLPAGERPR